MSGPKYVVDEKQQELLKSQHDSVQAQIAQMDPEAQSRIKGLQAQVDSAIEECNNHFFNDKIYEVDGKLRDLGISGPDKEEFLNKVRSLPTGSLFRFYRDGKELYKAHNGTVLLAINYIRSLENTVTRQYEELQSMQPKEGIIEKIVKKVRKPRRKKKNG